MSEHDLSVSGPPAMSSGTPPMATGYPVATPQHVASALPHKTGRHTPWLLLGLAVLLCMGLGAVLAIVLAPALGPACGLRCPPPGPPPGRRGSFHAAGTGDAAMVPARRAAKPLAPSYAYTSSTYGYALEYDPQLPPTSRTDTSIAWSFPSRNSFWIFTAARVSGQGAQDVVQALEGKVAQQADQVTAAYTIPGAEIGYNPGYGVVYDVTLTPSSGQTAHMRLVIIAAVKKGLAVAVAALGPFVSDTAGHPNPAQTETVFAIDPIVNSVTWPGDRPL